MSFAYEWFRFERLMVAARCLGAAQRLTAEMTTFATGRQVQGRPIGEFGTVAAMLADSLTELFAARAHGLRDGPRHRPRHRREDRPRASARWPSCTPRKWPAGSPTDAVRGLRRPRLHGPENVAERFFRELRVERIWEGTSEVQRAIIAAQMTKRGPAALA